MTELYESWLTTGGGPVSHRPRPGAVTVSDIASRGYTLDDLRYLRDIIGCDHQTRIFEGSVPPWQPYGTHVAAHCLCCDWAAWTYRNTDQGVRELQRRMHDHIQGTHEAITQIIPVVNDAPVTV